LYDWREILVYVLYNVLYIYIYIGLDCPPSPRSEPFYKAYRVKTKFNYNSNVNVTHIINKYYILSKFIIPCFLFRCILKK